MHSALVLLARLRLQMGAVSSLLLLLHNLVREDQILRADSHLPQAIYATPVI